VVSSLSSEPLCDIKKPAVPERAAKRTPAASVVRLLGDSYHAATLDNDAPEIFDGTLSFTQNHGHA
jgi:carboxylesterase